MRTLYKDYLVIQQHPLASRWEKFYLSKKMRTHLSPKKVSTVLNEIGRSITLWRELFFHLIHKDDFLFYDLSAVFTHSENLILGEKGYNAHHNYLDQIGIVMAFSASDSLPVGIDVFSGASVIRK